ncbi:acyltransferase [Flavobacteriaceae bacterium]|nr:acyltransferase [Flavobacteriaceae bacterium]
MLVSNEVSRRFKLVSALSMVGILFIHSKFINSRWGEELGSSLYSYISVSVQYLISEQITRICVPLFFIISGYFFYHKYDGTLKSYFILLKKQIKSILIPYLLWSLTWYVLLNFSNFNFINFSSLLNGLLYPIPYQFWFLKILLLCFIISPIFFIVNQNYPKTTIILLILFYFLDVNNFKLEIYGFGFFCLGGYIRYNDLNLNKNVYNYLIYIYVISIIIGLLLYVINASDCFYLRVILHKTSILAGLILIYYYISKGIECIKFSWDFLLYKQSGFFFFVYAAHEPLLSFLKKIWIQLFSDSYNLFPYVFLPLIILYMLHLCYMFLEKKIPLVLVFYNGNR